MTIVTPEIIEKREVTKDSLVVLSRESFSTALKNYEEGKFLLDENIAYLVKPNFETINKMKVLSEIGESNLRSGRILILDNQSSKRYIPYDKLLKKTVINQLTIFVELCQLLGAKKVVLKHSFTDSTNSTSNTEAKIQTGFKVNAEGGHENSIVGKAIGEMQSCTEFSGMDAADLDAAKTLIEEGHFNDNQQILSLYQMAINPGNKIKSQVVSIRLAEEVSTKLKVFSKIEAEVLKMAIGEFNLNRIKEASKVSEVTYEVFFK